MLDKTLSELAWCCVKVFVKEFIKSTLAFKT